MYRDYDNSDKESDYEEYLEKSTNITKKSLSTVGFRYSPENNTARAMALRPTQSLAEKLDELKFFDNFQNLDRNENASPPPVTATCPCGCFMRPPVTGPFRTREKSTLALYVFSPDILNYHGNHFKPSQIALLWKKDCRMYLWKGKSSVESHNVQIIK